MRKNDNSREYVCKNYSRRNVSIYQSETQHSQTIASVGSLLIEPCRNDNRSDKVSSDNLRRNTTRFQYNTYTEYYRSVIRLYIGIQQLF